MVEIPGLDDPSEWPNLPSLVERRTEEILDVCREAGVRATFFILGWIAERHPRLVAAIAAEGHELGSHSHWHRAVYEMTPESFQRDLEDSIAAIESAAGRAPTNLCYNASIIISVDTGPAHIAAYSNTPLIWIVKKSSYSITNKPYSKNTYTIEAEDMCSVTVEDIFKKILKLI